MNETVAIENVRSRMVMLRGEATLLDREREKPAIKMGLRHRFHR